MLFFIIYIDVHTKLILELMLKMLFPNFINLITSIIISEVNCYKNRPKFSEKRAIGKTRMTMLLLIAVCESF